MGDAEGEEQSGVRPTLKPVAHGECSQPSRGTDASAGPVPELWLPRHPGFRLLPQLPRTATARQAFRACPDHRDRRSRRARRGHVRRVITGSGCAQAWRDSAEPELISDHGELICHGDPERAGGDSEHVVVRDFLGVSVFARAIGTNERARRDRDLRRDPAARRLATLTDRDPRESDESGRIRSASLDRDGG